MSGARDSTAEKTRALASGAAPLASSPAGIRRWTFPVGLLACNCSIVAAAQGPECVVIDPGDGDQRSGDGVETILRVVREHQLRVVAIAITHAHIDHIGAAARLKRLTGAPVLLQPRDQVIYAALPEQAAWIGIPLPPSTPIDGELREGEPVKIGSLQFDVLETPGHTPGSACLLLPGENLLFAGDTLFAGSIGRTDLPGGDPAQIVRSVHSKILTLPDATLVVPGHGDETRVGRERETNPFLTGRHAQFR